jgi:hypothetical protein
LPHQITQRGNRRQQAFLKWEFLKKEENIMREGLFFALILLTGPLNFGSEPQNNVPHVATEPTPALREWENLRYGMFIHFGLSTFVGDQFGRTPAESAAYAPSDLDVDQWARTARKAGMKYMVLTVKHHYGHALWPVKGL